MVVNAASISETNIQGVVGSTVGSSFTQTFNIYASDVNKGSDGLGIGGIIFKLDFDEDVFSLTSMYKVDSFDTKVYKESSSYYVVSTIDESSSQNRCVDGILYCSNYSITLQFYTKNTDKTSASITMSEVNAILFNTNSDYSESSAITVSSNSTKTQNIRIQQATTTPTSEPASISISSGSRNTSSATSKVSSVAKNNTSNNNSSTQSSSSTTQSTNNDSTTFTNYLSSLKIKNHEIKFDKEKTDYKVLIKKKENKLEITATPEDEKSKVEIQGAENLKKNNYKVLVLVTSEDGYKRTYIIRAVEDVKDEKIVEKKPIIDMKWIQKNKNYIFIGLGVIVFIIIVIMIINKRKDKKLDKMFDNFDNF